jgi:hypothetical protein
MGRQEEEEYISYSLLTLALYGVSGQRHAPAALNPREKNLGTHWTGRWVDTRAGLFTEATKNLLPLLGIAPRSSSL